MSTTARKLVTLVVEPEIADRVTDDLLRLGARGYVATEARGAWSGAYDTDNPGVAHWRGPAVRIEAVVSAEIADSLIAHLRATWFKDYAAFAWLADVAVARPDKYA
jgi:nitrogen regulatory protein P-II 2